MKNKIIITLLTFILLAACSPIKGKVVDKEYIEPHTATIIQMVGKTTMVIPYTTAPQYKLVVKTIEGEEKSTYVNEDEYDQINIGDEYNSEVED